MKEVLKENLGFMVFCTAVILAISIIGYYITSSAESDRKYSQMMAQQGYEECPKARNTNENIWVKDCVSYKNASKDD